MATSPLDPSNTSGKRDRRLGRGHGTGALGPSDSSDTGADLHGAKGLAGDVDGFGLEHDDTSEDETSTANMTAGPDVGDANLDSDSDRGGTGEAASMPRDTVAEAGSDIAPDRIETIPDIEMDEGEDAGGEATRRRRNKKP